MNGIIKKKKQKQNKTKTHNLNATYWNHVIHWVLIEKWRLGHVIRCDRVEGNQSISRYLINFCLVYSMVIQGDDAMCQRSRNERFTPCSRTRSACSRTCKFPFYSFISSKSILLQISIRLNPVLWLIFYQILHTISLETKSCRILPLTCTMKYDMT